MTYESLIRKYFQAWQNRDWQSIENTLDDSFTFTSPYDDHIGKKEYKEKCWDPVHQVDTFEVITLTGNGEDFFVRYKGKINEVQVQNVEHFRFKGEKLGSVTVFFGRP